MEREVGGGIGMGNTCKPMAVSFQCMTKSTTIKKIIKKRKQNKQTKNKIQIIISKLHFIFEDTSLPLNKKLFPTSGKFLEKVIVYKR